MQSRAQTFRTDAGGEEKGPERPRAQVTHRKGAPSADTGHRECKEALQGPITGPREGATEQLGRKAGRHPQAPPE